MVTISTGISQLPIRFLVPTIRVTTTNVASSKIGKNDYGTNSEKIHTPRSRKIKKVQQVLLLPRFLCKIFRHILRVYLGQTIIYILL